MNKHEIDKIFLFRRKKKFSCKPSYGKIYVFLTDFLLNFRAPKSDLFIDPKRQHKKLATITGIDNKFYDLTIALITIIWLHRNLLPFFIC
jgi:hypothetical protein